MVCGVWWRVSVYAYRKMDGLHGGRSRAMREGADAMPKRVSVGVGFRV
jgi:hypothetical protein